MQAQRRICAPETQTTGGVADTGPGIDGFNFTAAADNGNLSKHSGRVFVTRHGQRATLQTPDFDPPLTADGRKQAELVAGELKKRNFS